MAENILESYFIRVGALPDTASFHKLGFVLKDTQKLTENFTLQSATGFFKLEAVAVGALSAIGLGLIGLADKTAMTDQSYRLLGLRMLMTKESARAMQVSLDELGATIDEVAYDPELNKRFQYLYEQNIKLGRAMGGSFDENMKKIRDYRMEVKRFTTEFEFLLGGTISKLFEKAGLSSDDQLKKLQDLNDWFTSNLPAISDEISTDFVPVWDDVKVVMSDIGSMVKTAAGDFQYLFGVLDGDDSIQTQDVSAKSLLKTFDDLINDVTKMILTFDLLGKVGGHSFMAIANSAFAAYEAVKAAYTHGSLDEAKKYINRAADESVKAAADVRDMFTFQKDQQVNNPDFKAINSYNLSHTPVRPEVFSRVPMGYGGQGVTDMRSLAEMVSKQTGIPSNLILDQWAHETGGFTSSVFKSKNNAAGIENSDKTYREYSSLEDFASDYAKIITSKRYKSQGITEAKDIEHFAEALKKGGYYEDTYRNYAAGMQTWENKLSSGDVNVHIGQIVVPPNSTPEQATQVISSGLRDALRIRDQRTMAQTAGGAFH